MLVIDYQRAARTTAIYPASAGVWYSALGLAGEIGELANKVKKLARGDTKLEDRRVALIDELGDCIWYVSASASDLGIELLEVAYEASQLAKIKGDIFDLSLLLATSAGRIAFQAEDVRNHGITNERRELIKNQLVNVLALLANVAVILNTDLQTVSKQNIQKLFGRKEAGTLRGDGDNR